MTIKDEELLMEFPCSFAVKAMGKAADDFDALVFSLVSQHVPNLGEGAVRSKASGGGKYLSVTVTFEALPERAAAFLARVKQQAADSLRAEGWNPYVIHLGARYEPRGALGYILAAREILDQIDAMNIDVTRIVTASGSGQTHSGLLTGLRLAGSGLPVTGICVRRDAEQQHARITQVCKNLGHLIGRPDLVKPDDVQVTDEFLGPGYGKNSPETWGAFLAAAREEGLMLDPVYTSKSFAGALAAAADIGPKGGTVLYLHTGGLPALAAYEAAIDQALAAQDPQSADGQSTLRKES